MTKNNISSEDYISADSIKNIISSFFRLLFNFFYYLYSLLRKNWFLSFSLPCLAIGLALLYHEMKPKRFEASMVVQYNDLNKKTYWEMFAQLNTLLRVRDNSRVAAELQISQDAARTLKKIDLQSIAGEPLITDTTKSEEIPIKILVSLSDTAYTDVLQKALLSFVERNPYVTTFKENQKKMYEDRILFIDKELKKIDSLEEGYTKSLNANKISATLYNNAFNPAEVYVHSFNLLNQKQDALKWLNNNYDPVILIDGFKPSLDPHGMSLLRLMFYYFLCGFGLCLLIVLFRDFRDRADKIK